MSSVFQCGSYRLPLDRPYVMAIINTTPDSFSGDGTAGQLDRAVERARQAIADGADMLDIGGESTRPGADSVPEAEELRRVVPLVEALSGLRVPISVDTSKTAVMHEALRAGASLINDINAFRAPGAEAVVAGSDCGVCLMHMQGEPRSMQQAPVYQDVVGEVLHFLDERRAALLARGVENARICIDPGFGFGKTLEHNVALFNAIDRFATKAPVLVGVSRKSMIGALTGLDVLRRATPSAVAALAAAVRGAAILRVHDVAETVSALRIWQALGDTKKQLSAQDR